MRFVEEKYVQLNIIEKQRYIKLIKDKFERYLARELDLLRVSAPLLVTPESGLQDDLSGVERKVRFDIKKDGRELEIVQSLAKWKRFALGKYNIPLHKGIYTDMTAIRRDDKLDPTHSVYVDQWDWERRISQRDRTIDYLKRTVNKIVKAIVKTAEMLKKSGFSVPVISPDVYFITSQELLDMYPGTTDKQREDMITREHKTVFLMQIGDDLSNGAPHDMRAPDYDDWALNGDLLFYHEVLDMAFEISSMGIRVNRESLLKQIEKSGKTERLSLPYHKAIISEDIPLSIGGGIGQSRLCQFLLGRAHIGEVQSSYWDKDTVSECEKMGIELL